MAEVSERERLRLAIAVALEHSKGFLPVGGVQNVLIPAEAQRTILAAAEKHLATLPPPMRSGTTYLCDMPGDGPWKLIRANGGLIAVSATHGLFSLAIEVGEKAVGACWKEMKAEAPE